MPHRVGARIDQSANSLAATAHFSSSNNHGRRPLELHAAHTHHTSPHHTTPVHHSHSHPHTPWLLSASTRSSLTWAGTCCPARPARHAARLFARMTARSAGRRRNLCASAAVLPCCLENFELTIAIVTLPRPALPAPSEMIWYVTPTGPTAEAAKLLALSLPPARHSEPPTISTDTTTDMAIVSLASHNHGSCTYTPASLAPPPPCEAFTTLTCATGRLTILRRSILSRDPLPHRLPFQAPEGQLHHPHLPPKYQLERKHLPGHPARPVEPGPDH